MCRIYVSVRAQVCRCGNEFPNKKDRSSKTIPIRILIDPPKGVTVSLGRERKKIERKTKPKEVFLEGLEEQEDVIQDSKPILFEPRGPCPVTLMGPGEGDVKLWISDLLALYPNFRLARECFLVWLSLFFERGSPRYCHAARFVREEIAPLGSPHQKVTPFEAG